MILNNVSAKVRVSILLRSGYRSWTFRQIKNSLWKSLMGSAKMIRLELVLLNN